MKQNIIVAICAAGLFLSACSTPQGPKEQSGMLIGGATGAVAGGLIGAAVGNTPGAIIGAGAGAVAGGFAGKMIGAGMDQQDRERRQGY